MWPWGSLRSSGILSYPEGSLDHHGGDKLLATWPLTCGGFEHWHFLEGWKKAVGNVWVSALTYIGAISYLCVSVPINMAAVWAMVARQGMGTADPSALIPPLIQQMGETPVWGNDNRLPLCMYLSGARHSCQAQQKFIYFLLHPWEWEHYIHIPGEVIAPGASRYLSPSLKTKKWLHPSGWVKLGFDNKEPQIFEVYNNKDLFFSHGTYTSLKGHWKFWFLPNLGCWQTPPGHSWLSWHREKRK